MQISNLSELLNATLVNEGSVLSVGGFCIDLASLKPSFAFFSNDASEVDEAVRKGAFVVVSEGRLAVKDAEVFYLQVENLQNAILRLLRFLCEEKGLEFVLCEGGDFRLCEGFGLKKLSGRVAWDFEPLSHARAGEIFCCEAADYLLKLGAFYGRLEDENYEILSRSSPFYTSVLCENLCFKNIPLPLIYAENFAKWVGFLQKRDQKLRFDAGRLDFFKIYFVNENNEILAFGKGARAFIVVFCEEDFNFWLENFRPQKELKTALKNSLFCDFSYQNLADLKNFKDFRYCLVLVDDEGEFVRNFEKREGGEKNLLNP